MSDSLFMPMGFLGFDASLNDAETVVFGAPYDSTCSFRPGTRFGPSAMRRDFQGLESYSPYLDLDLTDRLIHDAGDMELPFGETASVLDQIEAWVSPLIARGKQVVMLGGEHSLSLAMIRAYYAHYPELQVIHIDAHTDLRDEYLGNRYSHASVMRRAWEILGDKKIHQFGIRSGERDEFSFSREKLSLVPFVFEGMDALADELRSAEVPVYLSLDLDVLDPSVFPGTGTPEPGGVTFLELLDGLMKLQDLNIVGYDLMELSPHYDPSGASTAAACKLLREMLLAY